jgi:hypothetical protein
MLTTHAFPRALSKMMLAPLSTAPWRCSTVVPTLTPGAWECATFLDT